MFEPTRPRSGRFKAMPGNVEPPRKLDLFITSNSRETVPPVPVIRRVRRNAGRAVDTGMESG